ncbi:MAG: hypothetical protein ACO305_10995 [Rubrivivax sp.]|jgi:hypothetical protein
MYPTMTWHYETSEQMRNVRDELRSAGLPMENLYVDDDLRQVKVTAPDSIRSGALAILERHGLQRLS